MDAPNAVEGEPGSARSERRLRWLAAPIQLGVCGLGLATVAAELGRLAWPFELTTHFRGQYVLLLIVCSALLLLLRSWRWSLVALACLAIQTWHVAPIYFPAEQPVLASAARIRVVTMNVLARNRQHESADEFLREVEPDIVAVQEVSPAWASWLRGVSAFPHQRVIQRGDAFGIALLSRHPFDEIRVVELGDAAPCVVGKIMLPEGNVVTFIAAHTHPPVGARLSASRNRQLRDLSELVGEQSTPVVVLGDLNITPYSPFFRDLLRDAKLADSRKGFGVHGSWPDWQWLPIDHCLVSAGVTVVNRYVGRNIGSDHRPVIADLLLHP